MERPLIFDNVKSVVVTTLAVQDRAETLGPSTPLFGSLPELDSMAVVQLVYALEERFGFTIDDDEVTPELFETLGSLSNFVETKLANSGKGL
jgi:acyl carrier protein